MEPKLKLPDRIRAHASGLSRSDKKIADHLIRTYPQGLLESVSAISEVVGVDASTITRFFQKIGYESIRDAREETRGDIPFLVHSPTKKLQRRKHKGVSSNVQQIVEQDIANIHATLSSENELVISEVAQLLVDPERVIYIAGARRLTALSYMLYGQLSLIRNNVRLVPTDLSLLPEVLSEVPHNAVLVGFDFRRYPKFLQSVKDCFTGEESKFVLISDSEFAPLTAAADHNLVALTSATTIFDSYTSSIALMNAILAECLRLLGSEVEGRLEAMEGAFKKLDIYSWHD